jgi:hypothetical protein
MFKRKLSESMSQGVAMLSRGSAAQIF